VEVNQGFARKNQPHQTASW